MKYFFRKVFTTLLLSLIVSLSACSGGGESSSDSNNNSIEDVRPDESLPDTDGDSVPDISEREVGLNPNASDTDEDGLSDYDELRLGSHPLDMDSDGDGIVDSMEEENQLLQYNRGNSNADNYPLQLSMVSLNNISLNEKGPSIEITIKNNSPSVFEEDIHINFHFEASEQGDAVFALEQKTVENFSTKNLNVTVYGMHSISLAPNEETNLILSPLLGDYGFGNSLRRQRDGVSIVESQQQLLSDFKGNKILGFGYGEVFSITTYPVSIRRQYLRNGVEYKYYARAVKWSDIGSDIIVKNTVGVSDEHLLLIEEESE